MQKTVKMFPIEMNEIVLKPLSTQQEVVHFFTEVSPVITWYTQFQVGCVPFASQYKDLETCTPGKLWLC